MFSSLQKSNTRLGDKRETRLFPHSRRKLQISAPIEKKTLGKAPLFTPGTAEKLAVSLIAFTTGSSAMSRQWLTRVTHHYWNEKQVYFFLLQLYLNASQFLRASGSGTAGETPVSPVGKKGGKNCKTTVCFLLASGDPPQTGVIFQTREGRPSGAALFRVPLAAADRCSSSSNASFWGSGSRTAGRVTPDHRLMSPVTRSCVHQWEGLLTKLQLVS